jgi:NTP pyrophosphatase (non-canonical NTP hydrolase)
MHFSHPCKEERGKMKFDDYQKASKRTALYPREDGLFNTRPVPALLYLTLGLTGEAGEVAGVVKRIIRDDRELTPERVAQIEAELGDVLWYVSQIANELGLSLDEIAAQNVTKLADRFERDKIRGEGDKR